MTIPNFSLASIDAMNPDEIAQLPAEALAQLNEEILASATELQRRSDKIMAGLDARYAGVIRVERDRANKDFGKVTVFDGEYEVSHELKKRVDWDQAGLAGLREAISKAGDDPDVYITSETKTVLKVSETAYAKWPAEVKAALEPHRTVKVAGSPTWNVSIKL